VLVRRPRRDGTFVGAYYCKDAASGQCPDRAYVHADDLDAFVADWFTEELKSTHRLVDVVAAARDLEEAHADREKAEAELHAYVDFESALDKGLFQRGLDARQARVDDAQERVRQLSARVTRIPAGGSLVGLWSEFSVFEQRAVLHGFLDRVEISRGASSDLASHVKILWSDGTVAKIAENEERVGVAAA